MAWYTSHTLRFQGRLLAVEARYGFLHEVRVIEGAPLDLSSEDTPEYVQVCRAFDRDEGCQREIADFQDSMEDYYNSCPLCRRSECEGCYPP